MRYEPLFVFAADLHLEPYAWAKHPTLAGDAYYALQQIIQYCKDNALPLILGGDVFDKDRPDPRTVVEMCNAAAEMEERALPIYYIQGQHERDTPPWLSCHPWCVHIDKYRMEINGFSIIGLDWRPGTQIKAELEALRDTPFDILIAHQVWEELMRFNPEASFCNVPHAKAVLTGDYHVAVINNHYRNPGIPGQPQIMSISPGSTCMQSLSEPDSKGFIVVGHEDGRLGYSQLCLRTRPYRRWDATNEPTLTAAIGEMRAFIATSNAISDLPAHIRPPIVNVKYTSDLKQAYELLTTSLATAGQHHLFAEMVSVGGARAAAAPVARSTWEDALAIYAMADDIKDDLRRVLNAADRPAELHKMYCEFMQRGASCS